MKQKLDEISFVESMPNGTEHFCELQIVKDHSDRRRDGKNDDRRRLVVHLTAIADLVLSVDSFGASVFA